MQDSTGWNDYFRTGLGQTSDLSLTSSESKLFNSLIGGWGWGTVFLSGTLIKYLMLQLNFCDLLLFYITKEERDLRYQILFFFGFHTTFKGGWRGLLVC